MPLKHSGGKKAFSENVRTEMHAGKPQRQALAIAYSTMRRAGHKMAEGGECMACGGECKYAKGGMIRYSRDSEEKGVHTSINTMHPGKSTAGLYSKAGSEHEYQREAVGIGKELHGAKLKELKSMPKPKLKGLSNGGEVHHKKQNSKGVSYLGEWIRSGSAGEDKYAGAKSIAKHDLKNLKESPNPKLKGLSKGGKVYSIGPMKDERQPSKEALTAYEQGGDVEKYDDGGPVLDPDKTRDFVKGFTGHAEGGEIDADGDKDQDNDMLDMCADELLTAIHAKDPKLIIESLRAIIMSLKE